MDQTQHGTVKAEPPDPIPQKHTRPGEVHAPTGTRARAGKRA